MLDWKTALSLRSSTKPAARASTSFACRVKHVELTKDLWKVLLLKLCASNHINSFLIHYTYTTHDNWLRWTRKGGWPQPQQSVVHGLHQRAAFHLKRPASIYLLVKGSGINDKHGNKNWTLNSTMLPPTLHTKITKLPANLKGSAHRLLCPQQTGHGEMLLWNPAPRESPFSNFRPSHDI